jgi:tRNA nucleotidyltransferase (CCA-adding enzyme)
VIVTDAVAAGVADSVIARLRSRVPRGVREVCATLHAAGYEAVTVGGAVRDVLLGREPGDWDVAPSARPEQLVRLFRRTIPTGIAHGTVTVLIGHGAARETIEVTTYRGEGAYHDGRRGAIWL